VNKFDNTPTFHQVSLFSFAFTYVIALLGSFNSITFAILPYFSGSTQPALSTPKRSLPAPSLQTYSHLTSYLPSPADMADTSDMKTEFKDEPRENQEMEGGEEVSPDNPRLSLALCLPCAH
jgi:hypothetical protein